MSTVDPLVELRIELPAYSHSFTVRLDSSATIHDVKREIEKLCPGGPRPDGQRLVYKGRFLENDKTIADIWKSSDDARIVHLAVHPSAWTSTPPAAVSSSNPSSSTQSSASAHAVPTPTTQRYRVQAPLSPPEASPLRHVGEKHQQALHILMGGNTGSAPTVPADNEHRRSVAINTLRSHGWSWPSILDEEYPANEAAGEGVKYERVVMDGQPYLSLTTPNATPTPAQLHALKVLSVTLPILAAPPPVPYYPVPTAYNVSYPMTPPTNVNEHLQQLGLPPIRLVPGQVLNANDPNNLPGAAPPPVEIRAIPVRALIIPLIMLVFRTILIMYFFSPSKRPLFAFLLSAWILYEAWGAIRAVFGRPRDRQRANANGQGGGAQPGNGQAGGGQGRQARGAGAANANRSQLQAFLTGLSNLNLRGEDMVLNSHIPTRPPSISHKVQTFVGLLLLTLYPAVWDHRRAALRRREGRLRTEANIIASASQQNVEPGSEGESRQRAEDESRARALEAHQRRPVWVQDYVQRVQTTDWADDL
ncbi:hypothetical protein IEO21_04557 [Rhodonia placenta]|uniref:Ubiquitin-like domain-containing protein n=1 Tax=Rhodonia placenta TaxID=104341 RepID=A0A8H7P409_9APHY|nr:hypothetical protein IEO21_04557 [Postia placenta]